MTSLDQAPKAPKPSTVPAPVPSASPDTAPPSTTAPQSLQKAFVLCNIGVGFLVQGDSKNSVLYLTHALNVIHKDLATMPLKDSEGKEEEGSKLVCPSNSKTGPPLMFETQAVPDLQDPKSVMHIYNQAWAAIPSPACMLQGSLDASLLSDTTCLLTAVLLFNLALAYQALGALDTAATVYQQCSHFLDSPAFRMCRHNYGAATGFLLLAARNNEAAIRFIQGNHSEATKMLDRVRVLHGLVMKELPPIQLDGDSMVTSSALFWLNQRSFMDAIFLNVATAKKQVVASRAA